MADAIAVTPAIRGKVRKRSDEAIAELAGHQHGVVAREQLVALGVGTRAIEHRLEHGRLHRVHRGVYAVGHRVISREARWMAAVLACGGHAALSHASAGALWGLRPSSRVWADVTVARNLHPRRGIAVHRVVLPADEVTVELGIPVTTPARTLFDLAAVIRPGALERAVEEADVLRLHGPLSLGDLLARHPGRPGGPALRRILAAAAIGAGITRSELEDRFLALVDDVGLPRPQVNVGLEHASGWVEADCVWREAGVVVELDGYASHGTRAAFDRDRARDRALEAAGWRVSRVTWAHLHHERDTVVAELRALLTRRERT